MDYLPNEFADFVGRQRSLAASEIGLVSSGQEGDFAVTLMELSAMVAHVLGVYQDRFAREAFLGTAQSARSLARHGRRLGYEPDPGLAATGYLRFGVRDGLEGMIPKGFLVASAPRGEEEPQDYETLEDTAVSHLHNELGVRDRLEDYVLEDPKTSFEVEGTGFGLEAGDVIVIEYLDAGTPALCARVVVEAKERTTSSTTQIEVDTPLPFSTVAPDFRMYAKPATNTRLFGWDSPTTRYEESELQGGLWPETNTPDVAHGYVFKSTDYAGSHIYLAHDLEKNAVGAPVVRIDGTGLDAYWVYSQTSKSVVFRKRTSITTTVITLDSNNQPQNTPQTILVTTELAGTVSVLEVGQDSQNLLMRAVQSIRASRWLLHFGTVASLVHKRSSTQAVTFPLALEGHINGLEPGQLITLSDIADSDEAYVEIAEITSVGEEGGDTTLIYDVIEPSSGARSFKLGELRIRGNVARISHGKSIDEVLGDSDGTTPYLRFALKKSPLSYLPSSAGGTPALELRVGGVLWSPVRDFYASDADDLHYILQRDESGVTVVVFGDGRKGAIPPAGRKHITARYRVGLGRAGNAEAKRVSRIKKAHPLVEHAHNPCSVSGGADPAGAEDIRVQATRFIKTFDRAVSAQDHADLALLFSGVSRASAYWTTSPVAEGIQEEIIRVVVADADGQPPKAISEIKKYLELRRDNSVPLEVVGASSVDIVLRVYIEVDSAYSPEMVRGAVQEALYGEPLGEGERGAGLFTFAGRSLAQPAFLSEVYAAITAVPGVAFAEITELDLSPGEDPPRVRDVIAPGPGAWLRLEPANFDFSSASEITP